MDGNSVVLEFEIYVLMTMKFRMKMSHLDAQLESKLSEFGLSSAQGERVQQRMGEALGDENSFFANLKRIVGPAGGDSAPLSFSSVLWPEFDFKAIAGPDGRLQSARYWHVRGTEQNIDSPTALPVWSMDITEFGDRFGPLTGGRQWPLSDEYLPACEEREFEWNGWRYGAGFSWGLFMFAAEFWE